MSMYKRTSCGRRVRAMAIPLLMLSAGFLLRPSSAQTSDSRSWTFSPSPETVDVSTRFTSIAADMQGNIHLAYTNEGDRVLYAFRDVNTGKWFHTDVDSRASFVFLTLDREGNPHLCYTQRTLRYAHWDGREWHREEISPGTGAIAYYCSVRVSAQGIPHVTWYQERTAQDTNYLHMRQAFLENGEWLAKTLDWDAQTGKWHSMVLDDRGNPHVSFDAFVSGQMKYGVWDGKAWRIVPVDSRRASQEPGRGMGSSLVLSPQGLAMISYFEDAALKYAREKADGAWALETLAPVTPSSTWAGYRSVQALDSRGLPHIVYEDAGVLRHMYWTGGRWISQVIARAGRERLRYGSIAITADDTIYISYQDPDDGSLKVAAGKAVAAPQAAAR